MNKLQIQITSTFTIIEKIIETSTNKCFTYQSTLHNPNQLDRMQCQTEKKTVVDLFKHIFTKPMEYNYYWWSIDDKNSMLLSEEDILSRILFEHFVFLSEKYQLNEIEIDCSYHLSKLSKENCSIVCWRLNDIIESIKTQLETHSHSNSQITNIYLLQIDENNYQNETNSIESIDKNDDSNNLNMIENNTMIERNQFQETITNTNQKENENKQIQLETELKEKKQKLQIEFQPRTNKLTSNELHIVSKYFEKLEDYFHLEFASKKCKGNCERFRYNPISLSSSTIQFFPNIKTLHLYSLKDEILQDKNIKKIIVWYRMGYHESEKFAIEMESESCTVEFKYLVYTKQDKRFDHTRELNKRRKKLKLMLQLKDIEENDFEVDTNTNLIENDQESNEFENENDLNEEETNYNENDECSFQIPIGIKEIEDECFKNGFHFESIDIPSSVTSIGLKCFDDCTRVTSIYYPLVLTTLPQEYKAFMNINGMLSSFTFPTSLKSINGIDLSTFSNQTETNELNNERTFLIPSQITSLHKQCFNDCHLLHSISLSSSITSLPELCFLNCSSLTSIKGIEHIKEIGIECFMNCPMETKIPNHIKIKRKEILTSSEQKQIEEWTSLQCSEILFDSTIHNWSIETSQFDDLIMNKSKLLFIITESSGEKFGYYLNTQINHYMSAKVGTHKTDQSSFLFNLESKGRLKQMTRFDIIDVKCPYSLYKKKSEHLITLGGYEQIKLYKKEMRTICRCNQYNKVFDYQGIKTALCGKHHKNPFTMIRLCVIQMK